MIIDVARAANRKGLVKKIERTTAGFNAINGDDGRTGIFRSR